jgi:broad specificity phosphatase PhoE
MLDHLRGLDRSRREGVVVLVTHAELIRAAVMYCQGIALNDFASVAIEPASVTRLRVEERGLALVDGPEAPCAAVTA